MATYPATNAGYPLPTDSLKIKDIADAIRQLSTKSQLNFDGSLSHADEVSVQAEMRAKEYTDAEVVSTKLYADEKSAQGAVQAMEYADIVGQAARDYSTIYTDDKTGPLDTRLTALEGSGSGAMSAIGISVGMTTDMSVSAATASSSTDSAGHGTDYTVGSKLLLAVGSTKYLCQNSSAAGSITLDSPGTFRIGKNGAYSMSFQTGVYNVAGSNLGTSVSLRLHIELTKNTTGQKLVIASGYGKGSSGSMHFVSVDKQFVFLEQNDLLEVKFIFAGTAGSGVLEADLTQGSIALVTPSTTL